MFICIHTMEVLIKMILTQPFQQCWACCLATLTWWKELTLKIIKSCSLHLINPDTLAWLLFARHCARTTPGVSDLASALSGTPVRGVLGMRTLRMSSSKSQVGLALPQEVRGW